MGQRIDPDPGAVERLFRQLVVDRGGSSRTSGDPLTRFVYLEDREQLLAAVIGLVRREKYAMIAEASAAGMTYQAIGDRVGVNKSRVMVLLRKAAHAEIAVANADA